MMAYMYLHITLLFICRIVYGTNQIATVYLDENCGGIVEVENEILLELSRNDTDVYFSESSCCVNIQKKDAYKFLAYINEYDFPSKIAGVCKNAKMEIYTATNTVPGKNSELCGYNSVDGSHKYASSDIAVCVITDGKSHNMSFRITITKYYDVYDYYSYCNTGDVRCDNYRCIEETLECNNYQNCGDGSDENYCTYYYTYYSGSTSSGGSNIGGIIGGIIATVIVLVFWCWLYHKCCKKRPETVIVETRPQPQIAVIKTTVTETAYRVH